MDLPRLIVLVIDRLPKLEFVSPVGTFKAFMGLKYEYDIAIIPQEEEDREQVELFLFKTPSTEIKHAGQWRQLLFSQEKDYEYKKNKFSYFDIPDIGSDIIIDNLEKYFDVIEIHINL